MSRAGAADPAVAAGVRVDIASLLGLRQAAQSLSLRSVQTRAPRSGRLIAPFKGRGMEFEESRLYQPGDDLRSLDWRVTARTGKAHTKLFREERERPVLLWVDYRAAMHFGTRGAFKSVVAARAAALLAWSALGHGDRVGGLLFSEQDHVELRPRQGTHPVLHLIDQLVHHPGWTPANGAEEDASASAVRAMMRLRRVVRPGSLVFLLTDGRDLLGEAEAHLARLAAHSDVLLFAIHDPLEAILPPPGLYRIADAARDCVLDTGSEALRARHRMAFERRSADLQALARRNGLHFLSCATDADLLGVLRGSLRSGQGNALAGRRRGAGARA